MESFPKGTSSPEVPVKKTRERIYKWDNLKALLMIHGVFFPGCFFMPMTGMFTSMANSNSGNGGAIALLFWCAYFIPVGVLSYIHFNRE